jgi:hypothetical protein
LRRAIPVLFAFAAPFLAAARSSEAFEFFDGRLSVHGYYEAQLRGIARDMDASDDWDLTQWYNVLNVEIEWDIAPDGWGPFDLVSSFARVEGRYDCVWSHACELFPSVDVYGDSARSFPKRYSDARGSGLTGSVFTGDTRHKHGIPVDQLGFADKDLPYGDRDEPAFLWHVPGVDTLFGVPGPDGITGTADDPSFYTFERYVRPGAEYRFGLRKVRGATNGRDLQVLGPWLPKNRIEPIAALADRANPFNPLDVHPLYGTPGSTAMPFRPAPLIPASMQSPTDRRAEPRGLFIPNAAVAHMIDQDEFGDFDQNFREEELAWNRGASQQDEKELKEIYLDLELFDSRLWLRVGKQSIVWGKTELFRTTDQFNPQDLALASLPSLEESRIALWSARGVWSFFEVGPFEDVRLEAAVNFDQVEPTDLGRCGEPYTPFPVCDKSVGLFAHGLAGFGLAGEVRSEHPWKSLEGLEAGARLEFRWDRFSFAVTDFYGYEDFPYVDGIFYYERNVDPRTGRPRRANARGGCDPDGLFDGDVSACLGAGTDALYNHHANQQRFAVICASSVGFNDLDRSVCAQSVFNSNRSVLSGNPDVPPSIASALGTLVAGSASGRSLALSGAFAGTLIPTIGLNVDPNDGPGQGAFAGDRTLGNTLTDEQEALFGCGRFWGTTCDDSSSAAFGGIDVLNSELSVIQQSWVGFPGTFGDWSTQDLAVIQPGTIREVSPGVFEPFAGGAVARRVEDGRLWTLPGARSPFAQAMDLDPAGWNVAVDGCVRPSDPGCGAASELRHPYSGDLFQSELAAASWNFMITLVALSGLGKPFTPCAPGTPSSDAANCRLLDEFIDTQPLRTDGCSFVKPQLCANVQAIYAVSHTTRREVRAGGTGAFGRTDFDWHVGGAGVLRYEKRNVLGFSMDFAEDRSKSNWSLEWTWIEDIPYEDNDELDGLTDVDTLNLTVSVDRPTFINFLNPNRTFFINSQWFFQYVAGYKDSFPTNGPINVLATLRVETGYYRDRLQPGLTLVYDFQSASGAVLPEISYRFTENFSATFAVNWFFGRFQPVLPPLRQVGDPPYRGGRNAYVDYVEEGLSPIRDRDEVSLVLRYTF